MSDAIILPASLNSLAPLAAWLQRHMAALPVDDKWRFALDLAVCEAAANVIRHALGEECCRHFTVTFECRNTAAQVVFIDNGVAFPPQSLRKARDKIGSDSEKDRESGRGLMLILLSVDSLQIEREGDRNKTTLTKHL
ncbi:ATP-binding protein [Enterobacter sp. Bisph1]|uniref:ATP-binding protein n=1 Tax=Enterobacter sp. Bisph1 TaxID=1274399 RepID=UPI00057BF8E4|nr:ATP-binding protein [Enterobacter sp. Bisph1]